MDARAVVIVAGARCCSRRRDRLEVPDARRRAPAPAGYDPYLAPRDRDPLLRDAPRASGPPVARNPGAVLVDGDLAGLWRPAQKGKRLVVAVEALRALTKDEREALAAEAERLAPFRGAETAELVLA